MKKMLCVGLATCMLLLAACSFGPSPEKTVAKFESAMQKMDVDAMLDCFEPQIARGVRASIKLMGALFDVDAQAILDLMPMLLDLSALSGDVNMQATANELRSFKITVNSVEYNAAKDAATVYCTMSFGSESEQGTLQLVKTDGEWYIRG